MLEFSVANTGGYLGIARKTRDLAFLLLNILHYVGIARKVRDSAFLLLYSLLEA